MELSDVVNASCQLCTGRDKRPREVFVAKANGMTWTVCPDHLMALVNASKPKKEKAPEATPLFDNGEELEV